MNLVSHYSPQKVRPCGSHFMDLMSKLITCLRKGIISSKQSGLKTKNNLVVKIQSNLVN